MTRRLMLAVAVEPVVGTGHRSKCRMMQKTPSGFSSGGASGSTLSLTGMLLGVAVDP